MGEPQAGASSNLRRGLRWLIAVACVCVACVCVAFYAVMESRDSAEQLAATQLQLARQVEAWGEVDALLREERQARAEAFGVLRNQHDTAAARLRSKLDGKDVEIQRLEGELRRSLDHNRALGDALTAEVMAREEAAARRAALAAARSQPLPSGVLSCLDGIHECLLADGFEGLRFLSARRLAEGELQEVEMIGGTGIGSLATVTVARRMTAELDRSAGRLSMRFFDGYRRADGVRVPLPEEGYGIELRPVTAAMWESRLPFLVRAHGEEPVGESRASVPSRVDPITRAGWQERLDTLLAESGTEVALRLVAFRDLASGRFLDARVQGYRNGQLLEVAADCAELAVEVDDAAGIVSLLLRNGVLLRHGTESVIGDQGYRMLLPELTPARAIDLMLGLVVRK